MAKRTTFVGLDVHKESIAVASSIPGSRALGRAMNRPGFSGELIS